MKAKVIDFPEKTMIERFETVAAENPDDIALIFGDQEITYAELNAKANVVGKMLVSHHVLPGDLVAICMVRSVEMIVSLLGIWKAGAGYVPLNAHDPAHYLQHLLSETACSVMLTQARLKENMMDTHFSGKMLFIDDYNDLADIPAVSLPSIHPEHIAYIFYTSGSTGHPKGVMVEHRALWVSLWAHQQTIHLKKQHRFLQLAAYTFDVFLSDMYLPLIANATVVLPEIANNDDLDYLCDLIVEKKVNYIKAIPSFLRLLGDALKNQSCDSLHRIYACGEALLLTDVQHLHACTGAEIYNNYGPTETVGLITQSQCFPHDTHVTLGHPLPNTRLYVLNSELQPVPAGCFGELYIAKTYVAKGYLGQEALTSAAFIPNPFRKPEDHASGHYAYLYKSGDRVCWLPDGRLAFGGRVDAQVKIRGHRVELGELEQCIVKHSAVQSAAVIKYDEQLVAFVTLTQKITVQALRSHTEEHLPSFMQPAHWIILASFPLTKTGKLDRKLLPSLVNREQHSVYNWNKTATAYPQHKTIHQLFEEQAACTPHHIAIISDNNQLTYEALNQRANQLAHYLRATYTIEADDLIALCLERTEHTIIGILGVLKAGAAYVPIESNCPEERLRYILDDTRAKILLTDLRSLQDNLIVQPTHNPEPLVQSHHLAYIMYTSGTTGRPKGVMIEHRNVVSLIKNTDYIQLASHDVVLQLANMAFDGATFEIYSALFSGATLCIPQNPLGLISDVLQLKHYLEQYNVTILWLTTAVFEQLYASSASLFKDIEYLIIGGEIVNPRLVTSLACSHNKPRHFINAYGPTENTTFSTTYEIFPENLRDAQAIPIGKPIHNKTAYIVDEEGCPVPVGCIGELYVGGEGLARGYLNQPELTTQKFIVSPFQPNARLYKTGDRARYLPDGTIEYVGRNDFQVKMRGFRIELGEIENQLSTYPGIKQAIVQVQENEPQHKILVAYYVADKKIEAHILLHYLKKQLPAYMLPTTFIHTNKFLLTANGKRDRKALPIHELMAVEDNEKPRNTLELTICSVYATILHLNTHTVGICDDFFQLGGNSLLAIQTVRRLSRLLNTRVSVTELLSAKTPKQLALAIETRLTQHEYTLHQTKNLTPEHVWIIEQEASFDLDAYHTSMDNFLIEIKGKSNGDNSKLPLFVIPGGAGEKNEMLIFMAMSRHFDPNRPVYGVYSRVRDPDWKMPKTLEEQAQAVFAAIQKVQPQGPYHFLGECIAGKLAVALAGLAEQQGALPGTTILLDSHPDLISIPRLLTGSTLPRAIIQYYRLLHLSQPAYSDSELHLLISSDKTLPKERFHAWKSFIRKCVISAHQNAGISIAEALFHRWKRYFRKQAYLYSLTATHSTYVRQESAETVKIINNILKEKC